MASASEIPENKAWDLPPLILHPFNEKVPPSELLESSKAAMMLSGLLADNGLDPAELERRVLTGRYTEIRMLYFIGKDVFRWIEQCTEHLDRFPELQDAEIREQSIACLLTVAPPESVQTKLESWGVADYQAIFARAIGLYSVFREPPAFASLTDHFLRNYHRCADQLYQCFLDAAPHRKLSVDQFRFQLYASGEYSKMLETQWESS